jgi:hypothetical protein
MYKRPSDEEISQWVVTTCRLFGASVSTSYSVAGMFLESLNNEREIESCPQSQGGL